MEWEAERNFFPCQPRIRREGAAEGPFARYKFSQTHCDTLQKIFAFKRCIQTDIQETLQYGKFPSPPSPLSFQRFLSAAQPTDQGGESVVVVVVGGFGANVLRSPMYTQNGCIQKKRFFKMGVSRENFSS